MGLICAAAFTLTNCTKEIEPQAPVKEGVPFEITASINDTKTTNDGLNTSWVKGDAISVFHTEANSKAYGTNDEFTCTSISENSFSGKLTEALVDGNYDWYAFYPYSKYNKTPAGTSSENFGYTTIGGTFQTQTGNSNMGHIAGKACPMYGIATGVSASTTPSISMNHLTSVVKIHLTNNSGDVMTVNSISFTAPEDIVGTYYIDFVSSPVVYTKRDAANVSDTATLNVDGGEDISNGSSADFYIVIKPFTAAPGSKLSLSVNGSKKEITLDSAVKFTAGKIKTLNYTVSEIIDYVTLPWSEDFSGDLGIYSLVNGGTTTKTYDDALAGGAAPELLVAKNNGSFSAKIKAVEGTYRLTFKSNYPSYLSISVDNPSITIVGSSETDYSINIPSGVEYFNLTFKNVTESNARLDNIELKQDNRTQLSTPLATAKLNSEANNAIDVSWGEVANAGSYVVTATPTSGTEVSMTVNAPATSCTLTDLEYETEYSISVVAKPSDEVAFKNSENCNAGKVTTGIKPAGAFSPVSFSYLRDNTKDTITDSFTFKSEYGSAKTGYYQDGNSKLSLLVTKTNNTDMFDATPSSISVTVKVGGGTVKDLLTNNVYAYLVDKDGNNIEGTETLITTKVESTTGKEYTATMPNVPSAYGLRIQHKKETGYNVRVYSFSFSAK